MNAYLLQQKERISAYMKNYAERRGPVLHAFSNLDRDVLPTLLDFSQRGKMIRGGLVQLGYSLFKDGETKDSVITGATLELLQSALLIHDDIMDRDKVRRNEPSVFYGYCNQVAARGGRDAYHTGESLGICAGDIAFFLGMDMLSDLSCPPEMYKRIAELCSLEMIYVGMAQMQDVLFGVSRDEVTREKIFELYRLKTGRYSFSLPLMAGAVLAGVSPEAMMTLSDLGEMMGIVFQIKDDELGLFASEAVLGKPVGGDIREGKKTLFALALFEHVAESERRKLEGIFGNPEADEKDITYVRDLMKHYDIPEKVQVSVRDFNRRLEKRFESIREVREAPLEILRQIHQDNASRSY